MNKLSFCVLMVLRSITSLMRSIVCNPSQTECNQHVVLNVIATLVAYVIKPKICAQGDDMLAAA